MKRILQLLALFVLVVLPASAADIYVSQAGGGAGSSCASARTGSSLVSGDWVAGNIIHVCGTWTGGTNQAPFITALGSGSSGSPITVKFESGALMQASYFASTLGGAAGGAIFSNGKNWIVVDGDNVGIVQNTANGSALANKQSTTGVGLLSCNNCTLKNLTIRNIYVSIQGNEGGVDSSNMRGFDVSGSNVTVDHNVTYDVGWNTAFYSAGQTGYVITNNEMYHLAHGLGFGATGAVACPTTCLNFSGNHIHDVQNWDNFIPPAATNCPAHMDGIHMYANGAANTITGVIMANNLFDGNWGACFTGFVFIEDAHVTNLEFFNNVGIITVVSGANDNTNGWLGFYSTQAGVGSNHFYNNTMIGRGANGSSAGNDKCYGIGDGATGWNNVTFENNVASLCGTSLDLNVTSGTTVVNYNKYDLSKAGFNSFIYHGNQFIGNFSSWQTACACDANSANQNLLLNTDGSPTSTSPVLKYGLNLGSIATGNLSGLLLDTSNGNTRTQLSRPTAATCTTQGSLPCWDIGAFQFSASSPAPAPAPSQYIISAYPLPSTAQPVVSSMSPTKTYVTANKGCSQNGQTYIDPCIFRLTCSSGCSASTLVVFDGTLRSDGTCCTGGTQVAQTYASGVMTVSVPLSVIPIPSFVTVHSFTPYNPTSVPILQ